MITRQPRQFYGCKVKRSEMPGLAQKALERPQSDFDAFRTLGMDCAQKARQNGVLVAPGAESSGSFRPLFGRGYFATPDLHSV